MSDKDSAKAPPQTSAEAGASSPEGGEDAAIREQRDLALRTLGLRKPADPSRYERAYRTRLAIYKGGALASYSLLEADERAERLASLDAAYKFLRRDGIPTESYRPGSHSSPPATPRSAPEASAEPASTALEDRPEAHTQAQRRGPPPAPDLEAPGVSLSRLREHLGLSHEELAERTRISRTHLIALEEERFEALPPAVYIRGFAMQYARALGLSPDEAGRLADALLARRSKD